MTCFSKIFYHMFLESKKKKLKDLFSMVIGIQISVSGCFAKPLFNVVVRLGISLVIACYRSRPEPLLFSDDDGEYVSKAFQVFFDSKGIKRNLTAPHDPPQKFSMQESKETECLWI